MEHNFSSVIVENLVLWLFLSLPQKIHIYCLVVEWQFLASPAKNATKMNF